MGWAPGAVVLPQCQLTEPYVQFLAVSFPTVSYKVPKPITTPHHHQPQITQASLFVPKSTPAYSSLTKVTPSLGSRRWFRACSIPSSDLSRPEQIKRLSCSEVTRDLYHHPDQEQQRQLTQSFNSFQRQCVTLTLKVPISLQHGHAGHKPGTSSTPKHWKSSSLRGMSVCSTLERALAGFKSLSSYLPGGYGLGKFLNVPVPQFLHLITQNQGLECSPVGTVFI